MKILNSIDIQKLIDISLKEDCPVQDVTSESIISEDSVSHFKIIAKENLLCCGVPIAIAFFNHLSKSFHFDCQAKDGDFLLKQTVLLKGRGPSKAILQAERSVLNVLQHLSGIATLTHFFKRELKQSGIQILDTRKTLPGLRRFEKYAVLTGGGVNHRFSLSDRILLKENHLGLEALNGKGHIKRAILKCKKKYPDMQVEIEIQEPEEAIDACMAGADIIMLDNMTPEKIRQSIQLIDKRAKIEVSGGVTLSSIKQYIIKGVDYISTGAITHSAKASDISLLLSFKS